MRTAALLTMKRALALLAVAGVAWVGSGCCASFRAGHLERLDRWPPGPPPEPEKMKAVSVIFQTSTDEDAKPHPMDDRSWVIYRNATHWAYFLSQQFTQVREGPVLSELRAEATLTEHLKHSPLYLKIAAVLTLGLVPYWERREWTLTTVVSDAQGKELARFEKSESLIIWTQLLLTFAFPFAPPPRVAAICVFDLNRATIADAYGQGVY